MSTTASPPSSSPSSSFIAPEPSPPLAIEPELDIELTRLPAIVTWKREHGDSTSTPHQLGNMTLDLHHKVQFNKAFFKLSTSPVAFKAVRSGSRVPLHIFLRPEQIQSMHLEIDVPQQQHDEQEEAVSKSLGPDTVALHFSLREHVSIIVPTLPSLTPRNNASGVILDSLRELQKRRELVVYAKIPQRSLSSTRLQSLCNLIADRRLLSIAAYANLASCYNGRGGTLLSGGESPGYETAIIPTTSATDANTATGTGNAAVALTSDDHPPSYDELALSSPPFPTSQRTASVIGKRRRRRASSSPPRRAMPDAEEKVSLERVVSSAVESALAVRLPSIQAQIAENLSSRFDAQLAQVSSEVSTQLADLRSDLVEHVREAVDDLREEMRQETTEHMEDEYISIKDMLDDHVRDEVGQARDMILDRLTRTRFTLQANLDDDDA